ncbi:MAG: cysteine desulfurase [Candidatus Marinimicrobia bacterium]|nr:cysteine desulfurase [Candidatus Neomarinimicrobiota bacterium]MDP6261318.1 cysteine desulfurase [Candidatus Neomarinimicrobiota bacterium]MDP7127124.1 cysteine desulfurase [Candidatus Neomarinimicrobiota bacterium]MDP7273495.1 cysteine desulfurase [Candidatus Neomarinimicrobiota bacterium]
MDIDSIRKDFPFLEAENGENPLVYFDNASTTQKPIQVLNKLDQFYRKSNANVHRGVYRLSQQATDAYENARKKIAGFINAKDDRSIIFTRGTTESINLVAYAWAQQQLKPGDEILVTEMEHHSNLVPWQITAERTGAILKYIPLNDDLELDLEKPEKYFTPKTKVFALIHKSNALGKLNPVQQLIRHAKTVGAITVVDGAQSVPHTTVDVQQLGCDFFAFSGHKMLGPTGVGVLFGKPELLESMEPFQSGGEMIEKVTMTHSTWNDIPWKFEAGTPNIAQAVGLGKAIDFLQNISMKKVEEHIGELTEYGMKNLSEINGVRIYNKKNIHGGIISFNVDGVHPHDLAQFLDQDNIAIRTGHHCTQPIMKKLGISGTARISFYIYNTKEEIDKLCGCMKSTLNYFA